MCNQERLIGILSSSNSSQVMEGSDISTDVNDVSGEASEHNTIMRKYSVKNTLYHKTSPVIVTYVTILNVFQFILKIFPDHLLPFPP